MLVTKRAVDDHDGKKGGVQVGQRGAEAARQTPARGHHPVCYIVWLAAEAIPACIMLQIYSAGTGESEPAID